mgnify:CR=1 FL=1
MPIHVNFSRPDSELLAYNCTAKVYFDDGQLLKSMWYTNTAIVNGFYGNPNPAYNIPMILW